MYQHTRQCALQDYLFTIRTFFRSIINISIWRQQLPNAYSRVNEITHNPTTHPRTAISRGSSSPFPSFSLSISLSLQLSVLLTVAHCCPSFHASSFFPSNISGRSEEREFLPLSEIELRLLCYSARNTVTVLTELAAVRKKNTKAMKECKKTGNRTR